MSLKRSFKFQRTESSAAEHCCVPFCHASSKYNKVLSFHIFPTNEETRGKWFAAICRDDLTITSHTRVCSRHFRKDDVRPTEVSGGRRLLKKGSVPTLFEWNNYSVPPKQQGVWERAQEAASTIILDHDYALAPSAADAAEILEENASCAGGILQLGTRVKETGVKPHPATRRFEASDDDICFFTRFTSYDHLMRFWTLIEPSLPLLYSVAKAQRSIKTTLTASRPLQPIDEMFLFLSYLSLGLKLADLADKYGIHQFTVSSIITTWSDFLYVVLGSVRIWLPVEKIREQLPAEFKDYADTTVILDCTEVRCQSSPTPFPISSYKSHCTLKGLVGVAPHGAVTFISALFAGSINDKQIVQKSGILSLLKPGMAIMADRGFVVDNCVPCKVYRPAFLSGGSQPPENQAIACLRVHVERIQRQVKEHKFLDTDIPLQLSGNINQLYSVACLLTNYEN